MILSDQTIRELLATRRVVLEPITDDQIQPASIDVRLGNQFRIINKHVAEAIDPFTADPSLTQLVEVAEGDAFVLHPSEFVLGTTVERIGLPDDLVARVEGKSSLGRWGLLIHATAGFVDPGFGWETPSQITLELSNAAPLPIKLWPGMRIGQISFMRLDRAAARPYGHPELNSKYQGQQGPAASQYSRNRADTRDG